VKEVQRLLAENQQLQQRVQGTQNFSNMGKQYHEVGLRQQQRKRKELRSKVEKALWFGNTFGLKLTSVCFATTDGKDISFTFDDTEDPAQTQGTCGVSYFYIDDGMNLACHVQNPAPKPSLAPPSQRLNFSTTEQPSTMVRILDFTCQDCPRGATCNSIAILQTHRSHYRANFYLAKARRLTLRPYTP